MITYVEALEKIRGEIRPPTEKETAPVANAIGRCLAQKVVAPFDLPQFDNSSVDGYGVRTSDLLSATKESPVELPLAGRIQAGDQAAPVFVGEVPATVQILTGAPTPYEIDAVVMQEDVDQQNGFVRFFAPATPGLSIRRRGEEFRKGQALFEPGTLITPPLLASLAGLGLAEVEVFKLPRVGILSTGNELVFAGDSLKPGRIYESNSFGLAAALSTFGVKEISVLRVRDEKDDTANAFRQLLETCDVVLSTGGVSVGEFDTVKNALNEIGVQEAFWRVAVKPGKPLYFGVRESAERRSYVFGLPGNPVSALVTFFMFAVPALKALCGLSFLKQPEIPAMLSRDLSKTGERMEFVRCKLSTLDAKLVADPIDARGSHMLGSMGTAEGLLHFPLESDFLKAGDTVAVTPLKWSWV